MNHKNLAVRIVNIIEGIYNGTAEFSKHLKSGNEKDALIMHLIFKKCPNGDSNEDNIARLELFLEKNEDVVMWIAEKEADRCLSDILLATYMSNNIRKELENKKNN